MTAIAHLIKPKPKINWLKNRHDWLDSLLDYFWKIVLRRVIQITQSRWLRSCYKLSVNHWQFSKIGEEAAGGSEELKFFIAFIVSAVTASWYALLVSAPFNCWRNYDWKDMKNILSLHKWSWVEYHKYILQFYGKTSWILETRPKVLICCSF